MALYTKNRDTTFLLGLNREVIQDVITQQVAYYKYDLENTKVNLYGEASKGRIFSQPTLLECRIYPLDNSWTGEDFGPNATGVLRIAFLREILKDQNIYPEVGDVLEYNDAFYEVYTVTDTDYISGKDPEHAMDPSLTEYGINLTINVEARQASADRLGIRRQRF